MEIGHCIKAAKDEDKKFNIVIPSFNHRYKLEVIINCFLAQTCNDWLLTIVSDGPADEDYYNIINRYSDINNISFYDLNERKNDWGHTPREFGINKGRCEWTIMTGHDNYYVPTFIEEFSRVSDQYENCEFIFCDFVHSHVRSGVTYNKYVDSKLQCGEIDIGNFAIKTDTLLTIGFPFREYAADWKLVESILPILKDKKGEIVKIQQTLYVHN
jgi:glycosyltransferase involved in cell wall biosynthesis